MAQKLMLSEYAWNPLYGVRSIEDICTPALLLYPDVIAANIDRTLRRVDGNADRWRVHVKTAKLSFTLGMLLQRGVRNFKCATTLELLVACRSGAADVLVAYPVVGANARRVAEIAAEFPNVRISALIESEEHVRHWRGSNVGIFVDINSGMNRTGIEEARTDEILGLVRAIKSAGLELRGLHYYDGQYGALDSSERTSAAHSGYDRLLTVVSAIEATGMRVEEVVTSGTPTFPASLNYAGFRGKEFKHRISPGTVVYCDATSLAQLPAEYGYAPAALVATRVVSHPQRGVVTCDAGHKTVSADAGVPTCVVLGHPGLMPLGPSEEHLPLSSATNSPAIGEVLYLLPRHVCPTVNNFDVALVVRSGRVESVETVTARGRENPLPEPVTLSASSNHAKLRK